MGQILCLPCLPCLYCCGFRPSGIHGGGPAAEFQSLLGDVPAGHPFGRLQSAGARSSHCCCKLCTFLWLAFFVLMIIWVCTGENPVVQFETVAGWVATGYHELAGWVTTVYHELVGVFNQLEKNNGTSMEHLTENVTQFG